MNATFKRALDAVRWAKKYEGQGFVVRIEVRGSSIFATATRGLRGVA